MQSYENIGKFYQTCTKPLAQLAELNIQSFTHFAEQAKVFQEALQKRDPEVFFNMQTNVMNHAVSAAADYVRKFTEIQLNSINEMGKVWNTMCQEAASSVTAGRSSSNKEYNKQSQK